MLACPVHAKFVALTISQLRPSSGYAPRPYWYVAALGRLVEMRGLLPLSFVDPFERQIRQARMITTRYLVPPPLPNNLFFKIHPKDARGSSRGPSHASSITHSGIYNSNTPYDLDEAFEDNHRLLEVERELCGLLMMLYGLEIPQQRQDYRHQRDALVAEVKTCLDRLLRWTSVRWELAASKLASHSGSIVDSCKFMRVTVRATSNETNAVF